MLIFVFSVKKIHHNIPTSSVDEKSLREPHLPARLYVECAKISSLFGSTVKL